MDITVSLPLHNDHSVEYLYTVDSKINTIYDPCRDYDGKVTPEEVAAAAMYLKDTLGKEGVQELISNLSKDSG